MSLRGVLRPAGILTSSLSLLSAWAPGVVIVVQAGNVAQPAAAGTERAHGWINQAWCKINQVQHQSGPMQQNGSMIGQDSNTGLGRACALQERVDSRQGLGAVGRQQDMDVQGIMQGLPVNMDEAGSRDLLPCTAVQPGLQQI